jgi:hypothetical protein
VKIGHQNTRDDAESHANGTWTRQRRRKAHRRQMLAATPVVVEIVTKRERVSFAGPYHETQKRVLIARADRRAIAAMAVHAEHATELARIVVRETLGAAS